MVNQLSSQPSQCNQASQAEQADQLGQNKFQIRDFHEVIGQTPDQFRETIELHNYKTLWTYIVNCILALWLISGPFLFNYKSSALATSDIASGLLIILIECLAFSPRLALLRWGTPAVAFWLLLAPLIFWSPTPAVFVVDTLIACLVIAFSVLVPGLPGRGGMALPGPDKPPGWTYNPSSWIRRWLGIALALLGFFISRYLAAHQLGYIDHAWDPFFGDGSDKVTGSALSKSFPISDAGLGSVAYILETLTGFMGGRARWRTAPFIAVMFALLVLPLGATSIILVVMQPVVVGSWCGLCLISAAALLASVPLAVHEAVAVGQFLLAARGQKKDLWQVFWMGGDIDIIDTQAGGSVDPNRRRYSLAQRWVASVQGVTVPWFIVAQFAIGVWLMVRPDILPFDVRSADWDHILGALIVTIAAVATAEVTRIARFANVLVGLLLIVSACIFGRALPIVFYTELISGLALIFVSLPKGEIVERYAGWDKFIK